MFSLYLEPLWSVRKVSMGPRGRDIHSHYQLITFLLYQHFLFQVELLASFLYPHVFLFLWAFASTSLSS